MEGKTWVKNFGELQPKNWRKLRPISISDLGEIEATDPVAPIWTFY